jgi:hypothetical protein
VSVYGTIQPATLERILDDEAVAAGLAGRLLFAMPPKRLRRWRLAVISQDARERYESIIEALAETPLDVDENSDPVPRPCKLTPEAVRLFARFYNAVNERKFASSDDEAAALAKIEGAALRFALVVHMVRWASADPTLQHHECIDADSMGVGISLASWFAREARRVCVLLRRGAVESTRAVGFDLIRQHGGVTADERRRVRRLATNHDAELELREYARAGKLRPEPRPPGPRGGRPTEVFKVIDDAESPTEAET